MSSQYRDVEYVKTTWLVGDPGVDPPNIPTQSFGPVGYCIYCRKADTKLTDEHIIPANLGGWLVLIEASCCCCQTKINKEIERPVLQEMFLDARYKRGIGRRGLSKRPKSASIHIKTRDGIWEIRQLPYDEHPAPLFMEKLAKPGIGFGITPEESLKIPPTGGWTCTHAMPSRSKFSGVQGEAKFNPLYFGRLIAKIGHGLAVLVFGIDGFEPFLPYIIRGTDTSKIAYYFGGDDDEPIVKEPIEVAVGLATIRGEPGYVFARVRLFANLGASTYQVIVGKHLADGLALKPYNGPDRKQK